MKKKGKAPKPKPRKATRAPEDKPLSKYETRFVTAFQGNQREAAIAAGSPPKNAGAIGNRVFHRPNVQKAIKLKEQARLAKTGQLEAKRLVLDRSALVERLLRQLDRHYTHETRGDQDYYRGIRVGYESLQLIEGRKTITNNNTANSAVMNTTYEVFKASWKVARDQDMARRADAELTAQSSSS